MTHHEQYLCPDTGHWIRDRAAKKALLKLADRLDAVECHDRARYIRDCWQRVAARPSMWAELQSFVVAQEARRQEAGRMSA